MSHLSRHFLGQQADRLCIIPFPSAGPPDAEGIATAHKLVAFGGWNQDAKV